jgi:hypothetical protein
MIMNNEALKTSQGLFSNKRILAALLLFAAAFGLMNVFLMRPFMNPDEIQHFMYSANYAYDAKKLKKLDLEVLQLLKDHKWFHFIGLGPGWENIKKIEDIFFLNYFAREKHSVSKTYFHFIYGKLLQFSHIQNPLNAFYFLRLVSFLMFFGITVLCIFFYRHYFPHQWVFLSFGQILLFQPATILTSVNYDVLFTLCGVLFFIFAYRFLIFSESTQKEQRFDISPAKAPPPDHAKGLKYFLNEFAGDRFSIAALVLLSLLATLIKKGGLLFFIYLFLLLLFKYPVSRGFVKRLVWVLSISLLVFVWFNYWFPGRFFTLYTSLFGKLRSTFQLFSEPGASLFSFGFFDSMMDSFYFYTGWMGFKLPAPWYLIMKLFFLVAIIGVLASAIIKKLNATEQEKKWQVYALLVILLQLFFIWLYYGSDNMSQGRYLFPLLIPIITLTYCGLHVIEKYFHFSKNYLQSSLIIIQVLFFIAAIVRIISVFYLQIASPHAGL